MRKWKNWLFLETLAAMSRCSPLFGACILRMHRRWLWFVLANKFSWIFAIKLKFIDDNIHGEGARCACTNTNQTNFKSSIQFHLFENKCDEKERWAQKNGGELAFACGLKGKEHWPKGNRSGTVNAIHKFSVEEESRLATWWMAVCFRAKVNRTLCIENEAYQQSDLLGLMKIKNFLRPNSKLSFCLFLRLVSLAIKIIKENQTVAALKAAWMCTGRETFQRIMCMWNVNARYHFYQTLSAGWMVFNLFYFQCFLSFPATKSFKFGSELKT